MIEIVLKSFDTASKTTIVTVGAARKDGTRILSTGTLDYVAWTVAGFLDEIGTFDSEYDIYKSIIAKCTAEQPHDLVPGVAHCPFITHADTWYVGEVVSKLARYMNVGERNEYAQMFLNKISVARCASYMLGDATDYDATAALSAFTKVSLDDLTRGNGPASHQITFVGDSPGSYTRYSSEYAVR